MNTQNIQLFSVSSPNKAESLTQLSMQFGWLSRMGFTQGSLVKAVPDSDGMNFILCNDNIASYRKLLHETEQLGGKLLIVGQIIKGKETYSTINLTFGQKIKTGFWAYGNPLIAAYEHGIIKVKKLPIAKYHTITSVYDNRLNKSFTTLRLQSNWLTDFGFISGALATATAGQESITIKLWDGGTEKYNEAVKYARKNGSKLFQVGAMSHRFKTPIICITGAFIEKAGFNMGEIFSIEATHGILQLQKLALVGLGF